MAQHPNRCYFKIGDSQIGVDKDTFLLRWDAISVKYLRPFWSRLLPQTLVSVCQATQHFVSEDTNLKVIFCHHLPYIMQQHIFYLRHTKAMHFFTVTLFSSTLQISLLLISLFLSWIVCCQRHGNLSFDIV